MEGGTMHAAVTAHMRKLQKKAARSRWANLSPEQRSQIMRRVRASASKRPNTTKP